MWQQYAIKLGIAILKLVADDLQTSIEEVRKGRKITVTVTDVEQIIPPPLPPSTPS